MQQYYQSIFADYWTRQSPLWIYGKPNIPIIDHELYQSPKDNPIKIRDVQDKLTNRGYYHLINEYLISNNCYINTTNLSLKHIKFQKKTQGLQIYGKKNCLQLFGDHQQIEMWYKYLSKYTIKHSFYKKFNVLKIVGKGSHAKVYKVKRKADNEIFAVKVFKKERVFAKKYGKQCLMKEIEIMRRLQHPGVINLHEVYEDDDYVYLVIDFLYGGELLKQIENCENGYSEQQVQMIMNNLLTSLKYIHSKNILHRDIKPENLILRVENNITDLVIADFGLSDFYDQKREYMFQRCGTVGYVAPEVLKDEYYDFKVDMFSAGVIMFILLTGESPFDTDESDELITFNLLCQIDYNKLSKKKITPQAQDLVRLLLDEQVQIRLTAEQALVHDWFAIQNFESHQSLSITKIPQIINNQNPELFSNTPLWNQSIPSDQQSPLQNFQLDDVDESGSENNFSQQFIKQDQYEIKEDCIDESKSPSSMVPKYQLLVRRRSLD